MQHNYTDEMLILNGYDLFRSDRDINVGIHKRGGGLIIYVMSGLSTYTLIMDTGIKLTENVEQLFICVEKTNMRKQIIGNIYRPPNGKIAQGLQQLTEITSKIQETHHCELTIGLLRDLNINYNLRHTQPFRLTKNYECQFNLSQEINTSTRITKNSSTCIDLVFTNMEYIVSKGTLDIQTSDHLPVFIVKKRKGNIQKVPNFGVVATLNMSKMNYKRH